MIFGDRLFDNLTYLACADCTSTLADSETKSFVKSNRSNEVYVNLYVVSRHNHLSSLWESDLTGNIQGTDEELWTVVVVERSMTSAFLFLEDVDLSGELSVRSDGARFSYNLTSLDILLVDTAEEKTNVVSSLSLIEELAEHLDTCNGGRPWSVTEADELNRIVHVDGTSLDTSGNNSSTASD